MAATPEKRVKDKVVSILKAEGAYYFFPMTHGYGRSGVPDIVACVNGWSSARPGRTRSQNTKHGRYSPSALLTA